jgi:uncharacterized membrane protein
MKSDIFLFICVSKINSDTISLVIYILIVGLLFAMPYLVFPTLPFGVRIPLAYAQDPAVFAERRRYALRLGILEGCLLLANLALLTLIPWKTLAQFSIIILVISAWIVYYLSHRSLAQTKISQQWFANTRQVIAASLSPRSNKPSRWFWAFLALPCAIILLTAVIAVGYYPVMPPSLHFIFPHNLGDWVLPATPLNVFLPVIFQLIFTLLFAGLAWTRNFASQPIEVEDPAGSQIYQQINIQIIQALLLLLALGFNSAFLLTGLIAWDRVHINSSISDIIILAPLAGWLIIAPILLLGVRSNLRTPAQSSELVNRDDDRFWKLGMFYVNRDDPALLVAKRFGIGRTLNFGNPLAWVIMLALGVLILSRLLSRL